MSILTCSDIDLQLKHFIFQRKIAEISYITEKKSSLILKNLLCPSGLDHLAVCFLPQDYLCFLLEVPDPDLPQHQHYRP